MTIACVWWDESDGYRRITSIADARAAVETKKGEWAPLTDLTVKLFALDIRCHALDELDTAHGGAWRNPYYVTQVGIAYAGYCFEALTIIAIVSKHLAGLATAGDTSKPQPRAISAFISEIISRYFQGHKEKARQTVQFMIFGFAPDTNAPWLVQLHYRSGNKTRDDFHDNIGDNGGLFCIGDADICHQIGRQRVLKDIRKHAVGLKEGRGADAAFDHDVGQALMRVAEKKSIEEMVVEKIKNKFASTVGGSIQKMELHLAGDRAVVAFTEARDFDFSVGLPRLNDTGLQYVSIGQLMGRNKAEAVSTAAPP